MKPSTASLFFTLTIAPVSSALADSPDWTYVEASYLDSELDANAGGDVKPDGWELAGAWQFTDWAYVLGSYSTQEDNVESFLGGDVDLDIDALSLGIGGIWSLNGSTDLYGNINYEDWNLEVDSSDNDEYGYSVAAGIRSVVWQGLELNAEVGYIDVDDVFDGEYTFRLGGIYSFRNGIGIGVSYEEIDDLETFRATLRYAFR